MGTIVVFVIFIECPPTESMIDWLILCQLANLVTPEP